MAKQLHPTREAWLNAFVAAVRPKFKEVGAPLPKKVRVSIGFCKGKKAIGQCWSPTASKDSISEVFIHPGEQGSASRIADILTHELIHASGIWDHKAGFKKIAVALGLGGKMTATVAEQGWHDWADSIVKSLGKFPGAALGDVDLIGGEKPQKNRHLKLQCDDCGWTCRTAASNITDDLSCPTGCGGNLKGE